MATYRLRAMAELAHQLKISPTRLRLRQLDGIDHLVQLLEPDKTYPYDFVCYHITGYRPRDANGKASLPARALIEDLAELAEELSSQPVLAAEAMGERVWSTEQLARRFNVATKTICRWRRRGLIGRRFRFGDGAIRLAFLDRSIRRFVVRNLSLVRRGSSFRQLTEEERSGIVSRARRLLEGRRMSLHELSQQIAVETGRAIETVRYTLRRYDEDHPHDALFGRGEEPVVRPEYETLFASWSLGTPIEPLAKQFGLTVEKAGRIIREIRARRLQARSLHCIYSPEFDAPNADEIILSDARPADGGADATNLPAAASGVPRDLPPYFQDLYREPLLTPQQERDLFRRYNYLKFKAGRIARQIDPLQASEEALSAAEKLVAEADAVKDRITRANLRLVVSIARRHVGVSSDFLEIISDGNMTLMRAIESFDYTRGNKFSTYGSWAIMRNYARTIPETRCQAARFVTGSDELLDIVPDSREASESRLDEEGARTSLQRGLEQLEERERAVLVRHYGLNRGGKVETLDQIGKDYGVTKERVRQIERRAMERLREILSQEGNAVFDTG